MKKVIAFHLSILLVALLIEYPLFELGNSHSYLVYTLTVAIFIKGIAADIARVLHDQA